MMEGSGGIMALEKTVKYLKAGKSFYYKMASEGKILAERMEIGEEEILGHKGSKMTEIYTHISRKNLGKIVSPIDTINLNKEGGR